MEKIGNKNTRNGKENDMSIKINGMTWYYVDTVYDDDLVYDIYENELGEHIYKVVCSLY